MNEINHENPGEREDEMQSDIQNEKIEMEKEQAALVWVGILYMGYFYKPHRP